MMKLLPKVRHHVFDTECKYNILIFILILISTTLTTTQH